VRIACCLVPDLPLAAQLRAEPDLAGLPLALASGSGPRAEIIGVSPEASRLGVRHGSSIAHARVVCSELRVRVLSPALEQAARAALLDAALGCAPRAVPAKRASGAYANEAAVLIDASGVASLFRSEAGFGAALAARAGALGLPGCVAVASSRCVAHLAARRLASTATQSGEVCVLPPGSESAWLAPLPIDLLDPEAALAETLTRLGVRTLRDLLQLPRRALGARLGPPVLRLIALARGEEPELPLPVPEPARLFEAIDLEFAVERLEALRFVLQGLLSRLLARLEARRLACGELGLVLSLEGGGRDARRIGLAAPTLDLRVLVRLVCGSLEARPPAAAVVAAALETEGRALPRDQLDLFRPAGPAPAALGRTLAELAALCGLERVGAPQIADDHRPDAFAQVPFRAPVNAQATRAQRAEGERSSTGPAAGERNEAPDHVLAVRALRPPVVAEVRTQHGRPEWIRSPVASGRVVQLAGPWRTTGGWWSREQRFAYDYFDVQTSDGSLARLRFDHLEQRWQIDGVYD
jgi:protein ImuB